MDGPELDKMGPHVSDLASIFTVRHQHSPGPMYRAVLKCYLHVWVWQAMTVLSWHASSLLSLRLLA